VLQAFDAGNKDALTTLVGHWSRKPPEASEISEMTQALDSLGVRGPMLKAMDAILLDPQQAALHEVIKAERDKWSDAPAPPPAP
jgi:hypothetical protein